MIVTIDGPAGGGKSTVAVALAQRLGFAFLDTGAMYRAVTVAALRLGCPLHSEHAVRLMLERLDLRLDGPRVHLNGEDITGELRTPAVMGLLKQVADHPSVRAHLVHLQRRIALEHGNIVCEGRDQGTLVFPHAECKFYLTASDEERARRRQSERANLGDAVTLEEVLREQRERDANDAGRSIAPMKPADDALVLDTTDLAFDQVVAQLESHVRQKQAAARA